MAVFALFSGLHHGGLCPVQWSSPWRSLPCSAVLAFAVSDLFSGALPWRSLPCSAVLDLAVSDLCSGVWHDGPSVPSGAVAARALQGTDAGGGLQTSDDTAALQGTDSGGGLRTSDDTAALQGTDSGGGLRTSDDTAGGGVPAGGEDGGLLCRAALTRPWRPLLPLHHFGRSHS
ncbi:hypothetical protein NDU88_005274 [Pleurodeles waltl]|uniref:Uncharacterized protein n=1 Tax=Pleurodeles waltl TaxID=8319 RepID=A0AAV7PM59_PLEWA|nr:hypothetical protein NDU88_005274 [Pleurodeles waltl]